jgi:A/G-specific adenine glycosylase
MLPVPDADQVRALTAALLAWYERWGRAARDLPWRRTRDPYAVWISETMLQQTRTDTVRPYFERFLRELPDVHSLAEAPEEQVLALWSGLGYYRRARMLHAAARTVAREYAGRIPSEAEQLRQLAGIGAYTAGAVASIAFGRREALVDGNVARVIFRLFATDDDPKTAAGTARVWSLARHLVAEAEGDPGDWNQALMELGSTVCLPGDRARCADCPVGRWCGARQQGIVHELPRSAPKRKPPVVRHVSFVIASATHVVLARRTSGAGGLFAGLWEPPGGGARARRALAARLGLPEDATRVAGTVEHVLSHRRMRIDVVVAALGRRRRWPLPGPEYDAIEAVPIEDLARRGHATVTRKVLAAGGVRVLAKTASPSLRSKVR